MKELNASAGAAVDATPEQCIDLLAAVDRYPQWHPELITNAEALERDSLGLPTKARAIVHLAAGPLVRDFDLVMAVLVRAPREVTLRRIAEGRSDLERFEVAWTVEPSRPTRLELTLAARLDLPRFLPVGGIGESVAQGFVEAARLELEGSSPKASAISS